MTFNEALAVAEDALLFTKNQIEKTIGHKWSGPESRALTVIQERRRKPRKKPESGSFPETGGVI